MALPDELLDELLSAYLDGAASSDECARVEHLLERDPSVAAHFQSLVDQRAQLRAIALRDRACGARLPVDFAETVVAAAIRQARTDDAAEHHPLIIASNQAGSINRPSNVSLPRDRDCDRRIGGDDFICRANAPHPGK